MSEHAIRELQQLLDAEDHEVAFLEYVPSPTVDVLLGAARQTIEHEAETLTRAIASGTAAMPTLVARLARLMLR